MRSVVTLLPPQPGTDSWNCPIHRNIERSLNQPLLAPALRVPATSIRRVRSLSVQNSLCENQRHSSVVINTQPERGSHLLG